MNVLDRLYAWADVVAFPPFVVEGVASVDVAYKVPADVANTSVDGGAQAIDDWVADGWVEGEGLWCCCGVADLSVDVNDVGEDDAVLVVPVGILKLLDGHGGGDLYCCGRIPDDQAAADGAVVGLPCILVVVAEDAYDAAKDEVDILGFGRVLDDAVVA